MRGLDDRELTDSQLQDFERIQSQEPASLHCGWEVSSCTVNLFYAIFRNSRAASGRLAGSSSWLGYLVNMPGCDSLPLSRYCGRG